MSYRYFALVTPMYPTADDPSIVCRQWTDDSGRACEEDYTVNLMWERSLTSLHVRAGRLAGELLPISEEAALRFVEETQPARVRSHEPADGRYSYAVIVTRIFPLESPRALIRTWRSPQGYSMEQAWTHTSGWMQSDYVYEVQNDHLDGDVVDIAEEDVPHYQAIAEKRAR